MFAAADALEQEHGQLRLLGQTGEPALQRHPHAGDQQQEHGEQGYRHTGEPCRAPPERFRLRPRVAGADFRRGVARRNGHPDRLAPGPRQGAAGRPAQIGDNAGHRLITTLRLLLQTALDDLLDFGRHVGAFRRQRLRRLVQHLVQNADLRVGAERQIVGEDLVEDHAQ